MSSTPRRLNLRAAPRRESAPPSALREASAVVLLCLGMMTLLSLGSYHAGDVSLNATSSGAVRNWIGPAGAYWSDLLLQAIGLGAYALGLGLLLAGARALGGRRILPGPREAGGMLLLTVAVGMLAQLIFWGQPRHYPPGGALGAIFERVLRDRFAVLGAYILTTTLLLLALALTADGVLMGLGGQGWSWARRGLRLLLALGAWLAALPDAVRRWHGGKGRAPRRRPVRLVPPLPQDEAALAEPEVEETPLARRRKPALAQVIPPRPALSLAAAPEDDEAPDGANEAVPEAAAEMAPFTLAAGLADDDDDDGAANEGEAPRDAAAPTAPRRRGKAAVSPQIIDARPELDVEAIARAAESVPTETREFELPPVSLLDYKAAIREQVDEALLQENAQRLTRTLKTYNIDGHVREIRPGPVVTMYEFVPGAGIKLSKIASLEDDLAMSMEAMRVRIVAPIPGKGAVGIEIPNATRETVYLKEIIAQEDFRDAKSRLTMALGKDIQGAAYVADLARMPHLLVAGATGAGKSVSLNAMIMSVLFKATPAEVRMIMVDPKMLELSVYEGIPHLLLPVVTDPKKAALALRWAVEEMERRYAMLSEVGVRNIDSYNAKVRAAIAAGEPVTLPDPDDADAPPKACEPLPFLLVIVDELADLMMVASREVEGSIMRLAQMARAAGIHLILATQRPSVDVLTGVIKANFPTRIAFQVASRHDSRTILDANGAEHLLGRGDMLYLSPGAGGICRVHGAYVSDEEIERAVSFLRAQGRPEYDESILVPRGDETDGEPEEVFQDEMYDQAVAIVAETQQASISMIQRRLRIGYNRAARMVERMEVEGIVGPADGAKPRDVLISPLSA